MKLKNTTMSNGSTQNNRLTQKLAADYVAVEERSIEQLLTFVQAYAAKLTYYNNNNLVDGTWAEFFNNQDFNVQELVAYLKNPAEFSQYPQKLARYSQPHIGLLLTFLQLLQHPQQQFQDLTQRHLDFYYQNVLGLQLKAPIADKANIIITLEDDIDFYQLNKGTLLAAGQDSLGTDLVYSLDEDLLASQAQLARVNTLAVKKLPADRQKNEEAKIIGIVQETAYDSETKPKFNTSGFATFGDVGVETVKNEVTQAWTAYPINMGVVLSSPALLLEAGMRKITVKLTCLYADLKNTASNNALQPFNATQLGRFTEFFTIQISTEDTWLALDGGAAEALQIDNTDSDYLRGTIQFTLVIPDTAAAIAAPNAELAPELNLSYPAIRFLLKPLVRDVNDNTNYQLLKNLWLENIDLNIEVQGLKNIKLRSDDNALDVQSPFQPFSGSPVAGNSFYFGNTELCSKKLDELTVDIEWLDLPNSFKSYYQAYSDTAVFQEKYQNDPDLANEGITNDSFQASLRLYDNSHWFELGGKKTLFNSLADNPARLSSKRVLSYAELANPAGDIKYEARSVDTSDDELLNWSRYFKLELNEPDFMHSLYALVVSENANSMMYYQQVNQVKLELQTQQTEIDKQTAIIAKANADKEALTAAEDELTSALNARLNTISGPTDSIATLQQDIDDYNQANSEYAGKLDYLNGEIAHYQDLVNNYYTYYYFHRYWTSYVWWYPVSFLQDYQNYQTKLADFIQQRNDLINNLPILKSRKERADGLIIQKQNEKAYYENLIGINADGSDIVPLQGLKKNLKDAQDKEATAQARIDEASPILRQAEIDIKPFKTKYEAAVALAKSHLPASVASRDYAQPATVYPAYTPQIKSFSIGYKTQASINIQQLNQQQQVIQINPTGITSISNVAINDPIATTITKIYPLLPRYTAEATLFLGFNQLVPPQNLSLLFQMVPSSGSSTAAKPTINWHYLVNDRWQPLDKSNLLKDTTNGLLDSGILRFAIPANATPSTQLFTGGLYWLKAEIMENSAAIGKTLDIRTQAISATFVDQGNAPDHLSKPLAANAITDLVNTDPAVKSISQPYPSTNGKMTEDNASFNIRVSERLRHKQRGLTSWDYERLVLEHFPEIYKVKCISQTGQDGSYAPAKVVLIVIPNVANTDPAMALQPKAPLYLLEDIKTYLSNFTSPFVKLEVKNPIYQQLSYGLGVKFYKEYEQGSYVKLLNDELVQFLTPWAYGQQADIDFGSVLHSSSVIHFIEQRPYVDYVASLNLTQYIPNTDDPNKLEAFNSSTGLAQTLSPEAILVSAPSHIIDMISGTKQNYLTAKTGIGYFKIGDNFYVAPTA